MAKDREQVWEEWDLLVNLTPKQLEDWLETDESKSVGQSDNGGESKGHASGRWIVEILRRNKADYTDDDWDHMRSVVAYIKRHKAQEPSGDTRDTPWRYSLLNWGHDPLK